MKNITIVVPIYRDWDTIKICLDSLKEHMTKNCQVFLINDRGPEWEDIERKINLEISSVENIFYFRNESNLGFVKTCNRAVYDLDKSENDILLLNSDTKITQGTIEEMSRVLYLAEKHGVVCPRSNNATLLTVPIKNNLGTLLQAEESYNIYSKIKGFLPEYKVIPTGVGFAMLIKRELINRFGLFDQIYGRGYNEENDFCMRINQYGYSIIMANRAFVFHFEGKSFGNTRIDLEEKNGLILRERYSYYSNIIEQYFTRDIEPVDFFSDLICEDIYEKKRLLFSLYELPSAYNGTAEYGLSLLNEFYKLYNDIYDIHILTNALADDFFNISDKYMNVWHPSTIRDQTFHIAFVPSQIFHIEHLFILNRTCLKYIFCMQDIISLRSNYILAYDKERQDVFRKSICFCNGLISISRFSLADTKAYFLEEFVGRKIPEKVIYHGSHGSHGKNTNCFSKDYKLVFENYFFVFGNEFKHKFLVETLEALDDSKYNYIYLGAKKHGFLKKNVYGYKSGMLEDEFIDYLIQKSNGILFPSLYEGFGLPVLKGIEFDKKIVLNNNELNRELYDYFEDYSSNIFMFNDCKEIEKILDEVTKNPKVQYEGEKKLRTWQEVATESQVFIKEILETSIDYELLRSRWLELKYLENVHRCYVSESYKVTLKGRLKAYCKRKFPKLYGSLKSIKRKVENVMIVSNKG